MQEITYIRGLEDDFTRNHEKVHGVGGGVRV